MEKVQLKTEFIKLSQLLKYAGAVLSGGEADILIKEEYVAVNGEICTMRGKKIYPGDRVVITDDDGEEMEIEVV